MLYDKFFGYTPDPEGLDKLLGELPHPLFGAVAYGLYESGKGKLSTPYKSVLKYDKKAYEERQTTGDCVSHGTRNAVDISRAVEIDIAGELEGWVTRGATEPIYGYRGFSGQGMSGDRAARFVNKCGVALRQKYADGKYDFTKYNSSIGTRWGSSGVPSDLVSLLEKNKVKTISLASTIDDVRDALANGYGIAVCSNWGFSESRDKQGFAKPSGSWAHCMAWTAFDDISSRKGVLVQNSWGPWNGGGHPEWGPIPEGSFLIDLDVAQKMINARGTWIFSNVEGFPPQKLPNYGTEDFL